MFEFRDPKLRFAGFLKWWYPKTIGFSGCQNDDFGLFWGYQKHLLPLRASCQRWHSFRLPVWEILMIYNMIQRWYINVNDTFIHVYLIIYNTYIYNMYVCIHKQDESSASWPLSITPRILQGVKPAGVDCSYFLLVKPPKNTLIQTNGKFDHTKWTSICDRQVTRKVSKKTRNKHNFLSPRGIYNTYQYCVYVCTYTFVVIS